MTNLATKETDDPKTLMRVAIKRVAAAQCELDRAIGDMRDAINLDIALQLAAAAAANPAQLAMSEKMELVVVDGEPPAKPKRKRAPKKDPD